MESDITIQLSNSSKAMLARHSATFSSILLLDCYLFLGQEVPVVVGLKPLFEFRHPSNW